MDRSVLDDGEVQKRLESLEGWQRQGDRGPAFQFKP